MYSTGKHTLQNILGGSELGYRYQGTFSHPYQVLDIADLNARVLVISYPLFENRPANPLLTRTIRESKELVVTEDPPCKKSSFPILMYDITLEKSFTLVEQALSGCKLAMIV